jgi:hypothetical protein
LQRKHCRHSTDRLPVELAQPDEQKKKVENPQAG